MSLSALGNSTSAVEVTNISAHGVWLLAHDREFFMPYNSFPWFKEQPWPDLDVDLTEEIIEHPERFPNVAHST